MIPLKEGRSTIVVSDIGYASKAMDYYGTITNAGVDTQTFTNRGYPFFVISYDNYAVFYKDQTVEAYQAFFQEEYVKTKYGKDGCKPSLFEGFLTPVRVYSGGFIDI